MFSRENRDLKQIMEEPKRFYTPELQKRTRDKVERINCAILIAHGDQHPINKVSEEILIPELKRAGKKLEVIHYPGQPHSFYFGGRGTEEATKKAFEDTHAFFKKHLPTQPVPLDELLVKQVPVGRR
jgi:dienelactone hydrolase